MKTRGLVWLLLMLAAGCLPLAGAPASDRGIGGTGAPASGPQTSDRGIGGTGIAGVITGFGSVFVNGLEIAFTPGTPMTVDGVSDTDAQLRVGQVATIVASEANGLRAVSIDLRHEVSGPVTSVRPNGVSLNGMNPDGQTLVVSGQTVAIDSGTEGQRTVHPGDWVAVSGLREPDGVIAATRIDERMPGTVLVRGTTIAGPGGWRIGELTVQPPNGTSGAPGADVTVRGTMVNDGLTDTTVGPDVLSSDPVAFFGGRVRRLVIESYVSAADGHVRLGRGWLAAAARGVVVPAGAHRAIVQLERGAHGDFVATHLRGDDRFVGPSHGGPRGVRQPSHAVPRLFGPGRYEPRHWEGRRLDFGRGGFMPRRFGCPGCRRGRGAR